MLLEPKRETAVVDPVTVITGETELSEIEDPDIFIMVVATDGEPEIVILEGIASVEGLLRI